MDIELSASESLDIKVERDDDELRTLKVTLDTDDGTILINAGRFHDDAWSLEKELRDAADHVRDHILKDWEDVPEDSDGWVFYDRGKWYVRLEGCDWNGGALNSLGTGTKPFPTKTIAMIELARAQITAGVFSNCWEQTDYGYTNNICEAVRAFHNDDGDKMIELAGVQYEPGAEIRIGEMFQAEWHWNTAEIIEDYGTDAGLVYCYSGDGDPQHTFDRDNIHLEDDHDLILYRQQLIDFLEYRSKLIGAA